MKKDYIKDSAELLLKLKEQESMIDDVAEEMANTLKNNNTVYFFGTGHSHMIAEEVYSRAGGIASLQAILIPELMFNHSAFKSTSVERLKGYAKIIADSVSFQEGDVLFIISNSGRNVVPLELCQIANKKKVTTVAITSMKHSKSVIAREVNKRLFEIADYVLDNLAPIGDASYKIENFEAPMGAISTITGAAIVNWLQIKTVEILLANHHEPDVFISSNLDNSEIKNKKYFNKYHKCQEDK